MSISWSDFALLDEAGFGLHEKRALVTLSQHGVADAATLCRSGDIPTSKIYGATEKLASLGLIEIQRTRPKLYAALPADVVVGRLVQLARGRAEQFALQSEQLCNAFAGLGKQLESRQGFVDVALSMEAHVKRHLSQLASAERQVLSYLERGDLEAIEQMAASGFNVLKPLARSVAERHVEHRLIFGFSHRTAPGLRAFLKNQAPNLQQATGLRYSGEMGHPFHVIDGTRVILGLDHPFVPSGRFASVLIHDAALAAKIAEGFEGLWVKALRGLQEVRHWPSAHQE